MAILTDGYVFTMFTVNVISGSKFVLVETDDNGIGRPNCKKTECEYKGECYPKYHEMDILEFEYLDSTAPEKAEICDDDTCSIINRKYCGIEKCLPLTSM